MGILKNVYIDLGFLNPGKYLKSKQSSEPVSFDEKLPEIPKPLVEKNLSPLKAPTKIPRELPKLPVEIFNKFNEPQKEIKVETKNEIVNIDNLPDTTFFNNLIDEINNGDALTGSREVIHKDILKEMKNYWENKNYDYQKEIKDRELEKSLIEKLNNLHSLELEWQKSQLCFEKLQDKIRKKELEIESRITELKKLFKRYHLEMNVKEDFYFILLNGKKIRNLIELKSELKNMPDEVFQFHVNQHKDDFSKWINDIVGFKDLADQLNKIKSKNIYLEFLKRYCE